MSTSPPPGHIELIAGSMFSGKSEELIRRCKRALIAKQNIQVFKPVIDDRYSEDEVVSHSDTRIPSTPVPDAETLLSLVEEDTDVVAIDEVQFMGTDIIDACTTLADRGCRVIAAGLDTDSDGNAWGVTAALFCIAEVVTKLYAVCVQCHSHYATRSFHIGETVKSEQVEVGGVNQYEARCRRCFNAGR